MDPRSRPGSGRPADPAGQTDGQDYDGYDGRYSRAARGAATAESAGSVEPAGATTTMARPEAAGVATPVVPTRRRRRAAEPDDPTPVVPRRARTGSGPVRSARRVGIGILVGAALMLTVASLDSLLGAEVPVLGSFASSGVAPRVEEPPPLPPPPDTAGTCLTWSRGDATDTAAVNCAQPHLFEQAGRVALADQAAFPSDEGWQKLVAERCTPLVTSYLKGKFDPDGKFRVGALKPSQQRWDSGDKGMRCGLQMASRSGQMFPITGTVASQDQSAVQPAGTCLAIDGRTVGDPTDCAGPHAVEAVAVVDLGTEFPDAWPAVEDQDKFLQPACTSAAGAFAGDEKVITDKGLTVYWGNLSEESWKAGSRKVNCNIGTLLPDNSGFAAITGSVRGDLRVADRPAPPAATAPGAPAGTPSAPAAPTDGAQAPVEQPDAEQPAAPDSGVERPALDIPPGLPGLSGD